jgi:Fe-coproporphyrin III synthase
MGNKLHSSLILTNRCNSHCKMCDIWKNSTSINEEVTPGDLDKLPNMFFVNLAGGEAFLRDDLDDVIGVLSKKTNRIVISTNGYLTERILAFSLKHPKIGIRISLDGLSNNHDRIRGTENAFDMTMRTFLGLKLLKRRDIGFAMTIQDTNYDDLLALYDLSSSLQAEFATGVIQNSLYFKRTDNKINHRDEIVSALNLLIEKMLRTNSPKTWLRAYYNDGLKDVALDRPRRFKCEMAGVGGFVTDPYGNVLPCNVLDEFLPLGNLKTQNWKEIWEGNRAKEVRERVARCGKSCWSIGNVAPDIWNHPLRALQWVTKNKIKSFDKKWSYRNSN